MSDPLSHPPNADVHAEVVANPGMQPPPPSSPALYAYQPAPGMAPAGALPYEPPVGLQPVPTNASPSGSYPAAPPPGAVPTGRMSWALGFIAFAPIPYVSIIGAAVTMVAVYPSVKRKNIPLATENARHAANWALTVLTVMAVYIAVMTVSTSMRSAGEFGFEDLGRRMILFGIGGVLCVVNAVVTIMGTVISGNRVFRNRLAIPFIPRTQKPLTNER